MIRTVRNHWTQALNGPWFQGPKHPCGPQSECGCQVISGGLAQARITVGSAGPRTHAVVTSLVPECIIEVESLSERAESLPSLVCSLAGGEQGGRLVFS